MPGIESEGARRERLALSGLTILYLSSRLPGLRAMPIFGDEAIYVHWARIIGAHPLASAFVSLQDPKPPLHFWLMALLLPIFRDPLVAGRLLSVAAGAASLWLVAGVAKELARMHGFSAAVAASAGFCAALLSVFCPFSAFYDRMALAESLFLCEALAVAWLSLRATGLPRRAGGKTAYGVALGLGTALGAAMLTRQDFSYVLWLLPPAAFVSVQRQERASAGLFLRRIGLAAAVALILWSPYLLWPAGPSLRIRVFHVAGFREPISLARRLENTASVADWLATYLTPPVALFLLFSLVWLFFAKRRASAFLLVWLAAAVLPLILFGSILFSRYALAAVLPLWLSGGLLLATIDSRLRSRAATGPRLAFRAAAFVLLLSWPARDLGRATTDPNNRTLVSTDRSQYVTGWPAGAATEAAIAFLREQARRTPLVVLTPEIGGNPTDAAWVFLQGNPRVMLRAVRDFSGGPVLRPASEDPAGYRLSGDLRERSPDVPTRLPEGWPVYFLSPDPFLTAGGWRDAVDLVKKGNPGAAVAARFENPAVTPGQAPAAVAVLRLR